MRQQKKTYPIEVLVATPLGFYKGEVYQFEKVDWELFPTKKEVLFHLGFMLKGIFLPAPVSVIIGFSRESLGVVVKEIENIVFSVPDNISWILLHMGQGSFLEKSSKEVEEEFLLRFHLYCQYKITSIQEEEKALRERVNSLKKVCLQSCR